mmetsp:Transcript_94178/g.266502  ORF Transcript_94178/g.266502 Transcript_94178/m.266502 type:complete len:611 (+) Transcript_94178:1-1833(+)
MSWLQQRSGVAEETLRSNLFVLPGKDAVDHIFRVSAGLDSLIVGEGQILSQVTACHRAAVGEGGQGGKVISGLLEQAVVFGKAVRSQTGIAKGSVSISSAAVEFAEDVVPADLRKPLRDTSVAIVGSGKMARLILVHLRSLEEKSRAPRSIALCSRSVDDGSGAAALQKEFGADLDITLYPLSDVYDVVSAHDVAFFATAATEPVVTREGMASHPGLAGRTSPLVLVDVSVPRNVEAGVEGIANVISYNIDALRAIVEKNREARKTEIHKAEAMLEQKSLEWLRWHGSLISVPTLRRFNQHAETVRQRELEKYSEAMSHLTDKQRAAVESFTKQLTMRMISTPMEQLKKDMPKGERYNTIKEFNTLFDLYGGLHVQRRDDSIRLLEYLTETVCQSCGDAAAVTETKMSPEIKCHNFATHPQDVTRALARQQLAELAVIQKLSCGILKSTQQTLHYLEQRADLIRSKLAASRFGAINSEALQECAAPAGMGLVDTVLAGERAVEAETMSCVAENLAALSVAAVTNLRGRAETVRLASISSNKPLKKLSTSDVLIVEQLSHDLVNALLAEPTSHLTSPQAIDEKSRTLETFKGIFGIQVTEVDVASEFASAR